MKSRKIILTRNSAIAEIAEHYDNSLYNSKVSLHVHVDWSLCCSI